MATYYETLGVDPGASTADIRTAYLRRARALHPDRQQGRSPADARKSEQAMQQVNVAWDVLSNVTKRSEYDQRLRPSTVRRPAASRPASPTARTQPTRTATPTPRPARPQPSQNVNASAGRAIDEKSGDGSVSVWASLPVLIIVGLLLGVLVITAFAGGGSPSDNRPVVPAATPLLEAGDCFVLVGDSPRERSCASGQADGLVIQIASDRGNCPVDNFVTRDPASELFLCWQRLIPGSINTIG